MAAIYARNVGPRRHIRHQILPTSRQPFPVGAVVINRLDQIDLDHNGEERITKAGNRWSVFYVDGESRHIACEETGAWIVPTISELRQQFSSEKEWP